MHTPWNLDVFMKPNDIKPNNLIGTLQILGTYTPICCALMTHRYMLIFMNEDVFV
jgi:hypothetical protein